MRTRPISLESASMAVVGLIVFGMVLIRPWAFNEYITFTTCLYAVSGGGFLIFGLYLSERYEIELLSLILFQVVLFWYLRLLTLSIWPEGSSVLERSIPVTGANYEAYVLIFVIALVSLITGQLLPNLLVNKKTNAASLCKPVVISGAFGKVACVYVFLGLLNSFVVGRIGFENQMLIHRYFTLFFDGFVVIFVLGTLFVFGDRSTRRLSVFLLAFYVALQVVMGSRSTILNVVLTIITVLYIKDRGFSFKVSFKRIFVIALAVLLMFVSFVYGTIQRQMRDEYGLSISADNIVYILGKMQGLEDVEPLVAAATARAGYLDYSAEIVINPVYEKHVTWRNVWVSIVDNSLPGEWLTDSRRMSYRLRDVYGSATSDSYQSDAIGFVAENYLLFGLAFPVAIAFVAFVIGLIYRAIPRNSIMLIYYKYLVVVTFYEWLNSFGYDWLVIETVRRVLIGGFVMYILLKVPSLLRMVYSKRVIYALRT